MTVAQGNVVGPDGRRLGFFSITKAATAAIREGFTRGNLSSALAVYVACVELANDARSDTAELARADISDRSGVGTTTVSQALQRFVEIDLMHPPVEQPGKATVWSLKEPVRSPNGSPDRSVNAPRSLDERPPAGDRTGPSRVYAEEEEGKKSPAETAFPAAGDGEQLGLLPDSEPATQTVNEAVTPASIKGHIVWTRDKWEVELPEVMTGKLRGVPWSVPVAEVIAAWDEWERVMLLPFGRRSNKGLASPGVAHDIAAAIGATDAATVGAAIRATCNWNLGNNREERLRKGTKNPITPSEVLSTSMQDTLSLADKITRRAADDPGVDWIPRTDITVAAAGGEVTAETSLSPREIQRLDFLKRGIEGGMQRAAETPEHLRWQITEQIKPVVTQYREELKSTFSVETSITKNEDGTYTVTFHDMVAA